MKTRITIYRDPLGEKNWIIARDNGDPSEEIVMAECRTHQRAQSLAAGIALELACEVVEEKCELR